MKLCFEVLENLHFEKKIQLFLSTKSLSKSLTTYLTLHDILLTNLIKNLNLENLFTNYSEWMNYFRFCSKWNLSLNKEENIKEPLWNSIRNKILQASTIILNLDTMIFKKEIQLDIFNYIKKKQSYYFEIKKKLNIGNCSEELIKKYFEDIDYFEKRKVWLNNFLELWSSLILFDFSQIPKNLTFNTLDEVLNFQVINFNFSSYK